MKIWWLWCEIGLQCAILMVSFESNKYSYTFSFIVFCQFCHVAEFNIKIAFNSKSTQMVWLIGRNKTDEDL